MKVKKLRGAVRITAKVNGRIKRESYVGISAKNAITLFLTQHGYRAALAEA